MLQKRIIPCLLLQGRGLVKSEKFKNHIYVGDPINAVKIFNDKEVDELIFLDISARKEKRPPAYDLIQEISSECFMPICYGGGINHFSEVEKLFSIGVEKVALNTVLSENPSVLTEASRVYGAQSLVAVIDVKKNFWGHYKVVVEGGTRSLKVDVKDYARELVDRGAGEIVIQSVDKDGTASGFDTQLISEVSKAVSVPVVAIGGASGMSDFKSAIQSGASAVAAGRLFVFHGPHKAVLIQYPERKEIERIFEFSEQ